MEKKLLDSYLLVLKKKAAKGGPGRGMLVVVQTIDRRSFAHLSSYAIPYHYIVTALVNRELAIAAQKD
jgi:hypothetical protein